MTKVMERHVFKRPYNGRQNSIIDMGLAVAEVENRGKDELKR